MKNPCGKTVDKSRPYEIWEADGWTWKVLKKYQTPEAEAKNEFARWYCYVTSPFCDGEYGDTYVKEIVGHAKKTFPKDKVIKNKESFEMWMGTVDAYLEHYCGFTSGDLPDFLYRDAYDNGRKANEIAQEVLEENQ